MSIMMGMLMTTMPKAFSALDFRSRFLLANFSRSWSSFTKDLTTRMPVRFSWTTRFSASVFSCMARKRGLALVRISTTDTISTGNATKKTLLS